MKQIFSAISILALLSGCTTQCVFWCHDGTEIQASYVTTRDECQDTAEEVIDRTVPDNVAGKQRNTMLLEAFAKCMKAKNWAVTSPKKTKVSAGGPQPGDPWAPGPYSVQQQPYAVPYDPRVQQQPAYPYNPQIQGYPQQYPQGRPVPQQANPNSYLGQPSNIPQQWQGYAYQPTLPQNAGQLRRPQYSTPAPIPGSSDGFESLVPYTGNSNRAGVGLGPGF